MTTSRAASSSAAVGRGLAFAAGCGFGVTRQFSPGIRRDHSLLGGYVKYSLLDVAAVGSGEHPSAALHGAVPLARAAEASGFHRVWYAEQQNHGCTSQSFGKRLLSVGRAEQ
jgi:hypothetical protein